MKKKLLTKALGVMLSVSMVLSGTPAYAAVTEPETIDVQSDMQKEDDAQEEEISKQGIPNGDAVQEPSGQGILKEDDTQETEASGQDIPEQEEEPADAQPSYAFDGNDEYLKTGDVFAFNWKTATDDEINHVCGVTGDMMLGEWLNAMDETDRQELLARETMLAGDYQICEPSMDVEDMDEDASGLTEGGCYAEYLMEYAKENAGVRANYWNGDTGYYDKEIYVGNTLKYAWRVKVSIYTNKDMTNGADKTNVADKNYVKYSFVSKSGSLDGTGIAVSLDASQYDSMARSSASEESYIYVVPKWTITVPTGYAVVNTIYNGTSPTGTAYPRQTYLQSQTSISSYVMTLSGNPFVTSAYGAGSLPLRDYVRATAYLSNGYHSGSSTGTVKAGSLVQQYYFAPATYYVDYDGNGATGGMTARSVVTYGTPQSVAANGFTKAYTVTYNANKEDVASPAPGVATATFKGWTDAAGKTVTTLNNLTGTNGGVVTLKADWANGSVTLPALSKSGYRFDGWKNGTAVLKGGSAFTPTGNTALTGTWTANTYTIELDPNGGKFEDGKEESKLVSATYDVPVTLPGAARGREGDYIYEFNGWKTEDGTVYSAGASCSNLTAVNGEAVKLTADWIVTEVNAPYNYRVEHYIQRTPDGAYELFRTEEKQAERHEVVTPEILQEAVDAVIAAGEDYECEKPQIQTVTVTEEGMAVKYYYACVKQKFVPTPTPDPSNETVNKILEAIQNGSAFQLTVDGTDYTIVRNEDGTLSIQVASIPAGTQVLTIPSEVKIGESVYTITEIYKECFKDNTDLREVTVGNNITKIGDSAFEGCTNLKKVNLAEGLITIGNKAFDGCSSLSSLKTPGTLQTIGDYAFRNCITLKTVTLNKGLLTIGSYAFYNCKALAKVAIPDTVLKIGKYAFGKCVKLKTVTTSKSCATMGTGVFSNCSALTKITLKSALRAVPKKAFYKCKKLQSVKMENKVATIGESAFEGCSILKSVKFGTAVTTIGKQAFMGCKKLSSITLPEKVMKVREKAFYNCSSLKKVTVRSKVLSSVGKSAFKKCKKNIVFSVPDAKISAYSRLLKGKY